MARVPPSKPSPLDCPRHDEPELSFRRRKKGRPGRRNRQRAIHEKQGCGASHRAPVRARLGRHSNANRAGPHRTEHYRVRRVPPHDDAQKPVVPVLQRKQRALASESDKTGNRAWLLQNRGRQRKEIFARLPRRREKSAQWRICRNECAPLSVTKALKQPKKPSAPVSESTNRPFADH